jgi:hypothetical protein
MPTKTNASKKTKTNASTNAKPSKKATAKKAPSAIQGSLFDLDKMEQPNIEVTLRVPRGVPITIGAKPQNAAAQEEPLSLEKALARLASASKDELRAAMAATQLQSQQIIGLCTVLHGNLYRLASIGAKVSRKNRK